MFSRYLVIALAFIAAGVKAGQSAYVETLGLLGLGAGLVALRVSDGRPIMKVAAYLCFLATFLAIAILLVRQVY